MRFLKCVTRILAVSVLLLGSRVPAQETPDDQTQVKQWCEALQDKLVHKLKWRQTVCKDVVWKSGGKSVDGRPLVYAEFGDEKASNVTLIFTMVHGDEVTPLFIGIELAQWLHDNPGNLSGKRIVVAPLVNPDGFFKAKPTRVNARGVDLNRNFLTGDWKSKALQAWKSKFRSDPRRYPGSVPASEPETLFQKELIDRYRPQKILSIHSPLNHTDYDGPENLHLDRFSRDYVKECLRLRGQLKAVSTGFFPGSLGNFAGQELGIPTVTLELPTANPRKARVYWNQFQQGIQTMIEFKFPESMAATQARQ